MKHRTDKKRRYGGFFARIFAVMAASALAAGVVVCVGRYQKDSEAAINSTWGKIEEFRDWMSDPKNADATGEMIRIRLGMQLVTDDWYMDRGAVLRDLETNEVYDSSRIVWCFVKTRADNTESIAALQEAAKDYPFLDSFDEKGNFIHHYICDDPALIEAVNENQGSALLHDYVITATDLYVKGERFVPEGCTVTTFNLLVDEEKPVKETALSVTPEIPEGSVHFVRKDAESIPADALTADAAFVMLIGSKQDSPALQEAQELYRWCLMNELYDYDVDKTRFSPVWTKIVQDRTVINDAEGKPRWELYTITNYSFLLENIVNFVIIGGGLLLLMLILSALIARIRYVQYSKEYELSQYRRDLTASLAHDLKTPLTAISGYAENLRENVHTEKRSAYADAILENAQYMDRMIADVLELAKLERSPGHAAERVDLVKLAQEAADRLSELAEERGLTVTCTGVCEAVADTKMLQQAVGNLLGNAVKYTPQGGCITVTGEGKRFTVRNAITEEKLDTAKFAEPFIKGDAARSTRSGSGLGLAIVRQICEVHGFRFTVTSENHTFTAEIRVK